ncbi:Protein FAR-RED IMPAIRED RESPONSE 1 [Linum grandiflorum]
MLYGEESAINEYFREKQKSNPGYFVEVEIYAREQMAYIFWADQRMQDDYAVFGDSITFDTTYRTNRNCRPLALFVGFNNHHQGVILGACLMYDETIESYEWVFRTFLRCMRGKAPKTIFTDQDKAMAPALRSQMPDTFHALCTFHILQNAKRNLGVLFTPEFVRHLLFLFYQVDSQHDFDSAWNIMLRECFQDGGVTGHQWLEYIVKFHT